MHLRNSLECHLQNTKQKKGNKFVKHQEKNKRAGTENVAEIVGLGKACEIARINLSSHVTYLSRLRNYYFNLLNRYFKDRFRINGSVQNRLPRKC